MDTTDAIEVWIVRTDLDHLLIYARYPERLPDGTWPRVGRRPDRGAAVERFCELALLYLGWDTLPKNAPVKVQLVTP